MLNIFWFLIDFCIVCSWHFNLLCHSTCLKSINNLPVGKLNSNFNSHSSSKWPKICPGDSLFCKSEILVKCLQVVNDVPQAIIVCLFQVEAAVAASNTSVECYNTIWKIFSAWMNNFRTILCSFVWNKKVIVGYWRLKNTCYNAMVSYTLDSWLYFTICIFFTQRHLYNHSIHTEHKIWHRHSFYIRLFKLFHPQYLHKYPLCRLKCHTSTKSTLLIAWYQWMQQYQVIITWLTFHSKHKNRT